MVHGSDSPESAEREAKLFFPEPLILASASPQRRAILEQVGIPFEVRASGVEEETAGDPAWVAEENARRKALAVAAGAGDALVLGADTDVALDGDILGKPRDAAAGARFLARLSGRTHEVVGGIVLARGGEVLATAVERTAVTFRTLDRATLDWYVRPGSGRAAPAATRSRAAARCWSPKSGATI